MIFFAQINFCSYGWCELANAFCSNFEIAFWLARWGNILILILIERQRNLCGIIILN